ncbi:MAG: hypothetical protein KF802_13835 [Bdellovibrionaceae bacterium]|nr:hypothetical protein [Pseudobdellovibrionaceae bacterium]MBX3033109.1 hypothetical protein [Pseudobdellovibrionaceae bacterium]
MPPKTKQTTILIPLGLLLLTLPSPQARAVRELAKPLAFISNQFAGSKAACVSRVVEREINPAAYQGDEKTVFIENKGMRATNEQRLAASPCLSALAVRFYQDLNQNHLSSQRPALKEVAGQGERRHLKPGWLWDKAIDLTRGNPRLAMALINICLNDDIPNATKKIFVRMDRDEASRIKKTYAEYGSEQNKKTDPKWSMLTMDRYLSYLKEFKESETPGQFDVPVDLICPERKNEAFVPGSLSLNTDLPEEVKKTIIDLQSLEPAAAPLPAKSYHVYGSAALGCALSNCGLNETEIRSIHDKMAMVYRGIRLCAHTKEVNQLRKDLEKAGLKRQTTGQREKFLQTLTSLKTQSDFFDLLPGRKMEGYFALTSDITQSQKNWRDNAPERKKAILRLLTLMDAGQMYEDGNLFKDGALPCVFATYTGPQLQGEETLKGSFFDRALYGNGCRQKGWSQQRCDEAAKLLQTWEVDELWTRAQHIRGGLFGFQKCKASQTEEKDFEKLSCALIRDQAGQKTPLPAQDGQK